MTPALKSQTLLVASLAALFASGLVIGRLTAPAPPAATAPPTPTSSWAETAAATLVSDLQLDASQAKQLGTLLTPVGTALTTDQTSALFTMHLRLLRVHDSIAAEVRLTAAQAARLAASRAKLKTLIISRFPQMVSQNPTLALDSSDTE